MAGRPKIFSVRGCGGRLIANIAHQSRGLRWIGFPRMSVSDCCAGCNKTKILTTGGTEVHRGAEGEKQMLSCVLACGYRTTMFTSFFGTTMTLTTCLPA